MKLFVRTVAFAILILGAQGLVAATTAKMETTESGIGIEGEKAPPKEGKAGKRSTDVSFEDVLVQGKYHFSDEAVTTVEQDKVLDSLLGVRKDFKDRIRKSVSQQ